MSLLTRSSCSFNVQIVFFKSIHFWTRIFYRKLFLRSQQHYRQFSITLSILYTLRLYTCTCVKSKANNAAKASESAFCQQSTMIPGSPMHTEIQQLSRAHIQGCDRETVFLKEVVNIGRITHIPISEMLLASTGKKHHYISIRSVASYLLERFPSKLLAGHTNPDASRFQNLLTQWWQAFRVLQPEHDVYTRYGDELDSVLPMKLHCDEGTGQRRAPVMQYSWGPLGRLQRCLH